MRNNLGPIVLIVLGALLLLSNLELLPIGELRALVSTWWPLALSSYAAVMPAGPEPITAAERPVSRAGGAGRQAISGNASAR